MKKINLLLWKIHDPLGSRPGHQIMEFVMQKIQSNEARPGDRTLHESRRIIIDIKLLVEYLYLRRKIPTLECFLRVKDENIRH